MASSTFCESVSQIEQAIIDSEGDLRRRYPKVRVYLARITPIVAEEMLRRNARNRKVKDRHVDVLTQTLRARDMLLNGETIIFSSDGALLDGQHRLIACIRSGVSFDALVVFGVSPRAFSTIDGGVPRGTADVLGLMKVEDHNKVAGAIQALISFVDNGGHLNDSCAGGSVRKSTPPLAARVLEEHPGIRNSVLAMSRNSMMKNQHGFALHYVFGLVDQNLADEFASVLAKGSPDVGRPFMVLREQLINTPMRTDLRASYADKAVIAFNAERFGMRPKIIRAGKERTLVSGLDLDALAKTIG